MPYYKPLNIIILGFDGVLGSALTGALDLFSFTGVSWQRFSGEPVEPRFKVQIASLHKQEIRCSNRLILQTHCDLTTIDTCDLLLIPTIGDSVDKVINQHLSLLPHIIRIYNSGADIASNCSGAFFLAKAGLLNHRNATTHWGYAEKLAKEYPLINLKESALVTQSDNIFCAAGGSAFYDLGLLLIERFCGRDIASQSAKTQVIDSRRSSQNAYAKVNLHKRHNDALISMIQDFIEDNYAAPLSINLLCEQFNLIPRTLNRRFQKSANMRPIQYIQTIRIEQAKRLLEQEQIQIKALANLVGYDDSSSFNRLFKKQTGLSPKEYKDTCYKTPNF